MFELTFSEKINNDIVSSINYIKNKLKAPMAAHNHVEELKKKYIKLRPVPCQPVYQKVQVILLTFLIPNCSFLIFPVFLSHGDYRFYRRRYGRAYLPRAGDH